MTWMQLKQILLEVIVFWMIDIRTSTGWFSNSSPAEIVHCSNNFECNREAGQICLHLYEGCPKIGQCMCDHPARLISDETSGRCTTLRHGEESCESDAMCRDGMTCRGGLCRCLNGRMTSDRLHCLRHNHRLVGEKCSAKENTCFQKSAAGYTSGDVTCSSHGVCACSEGHKADGITCRRRRVYEYGCKKSFHCEGGAVCADNRCVCPTGYTTTKTGGLKCIRIGAITNFGVGAECDEINDRVYCASGLVCHKCASENVYHCVRFLLADDYSLTSTGISRQSSSSTCLFTLAILATLFATVR